jgi:hypothetical protein
LAWLHNSYDACLVGRRWERRGRAPTACRAAEGVALLFTRDDDFGRFCFAFGVDCAAIAVLGDLLLVGGAIVRDPVAWGSRGHVARIPSEQNIAEASSPLPDAIVDPPHRQISWICLSERPHVLILATKALFRTFTSLQRLCDRIFAPNHGSPQTSSARIDPYLPV